MAPGGEVRAPRGPSAYRRKPSRAVRRRSCTCHRRDQQGPSQCPATTRRRQAAATVKAVASRVQAARREDGAPITPCIPRPRSSRRQQSCGTRAHLPCRARLRNRPSRIRMVRGKARSAQASGNMVLWWPESRRRAAAPIWRDRHRFVRVGRNTAFLRTNLYKRVGGLT